MNLSLRPVTEKDVNEFSGTESYGGMSDKERLCMIQDSIRGICRDKYYKLLAAVDGSDVVGFVSLCGHSAHNVSIGLDIRQEYRNRGYGTAALRLALDFVRREGFTVASATMRENNAASQALNPKLGFEELTGYVNDRGIRIKVFVKNLLDRGIIDS